MLRSRLDVYLRARIQAGVDVEQVAAPGVPHVFLDRHLEVALVGGAGLDEPDVVGCDGGPSVAGECGPLHGQPLLTGGEGAN